MADGNVNSNNKTNNNFVWPVRGDNDALHLFSKVEMEAFLADRLRLRLNKKRQSLQPASNGINFLGYIAVKYGFPVRLERAFTDKIKRYGKSLTVIKEADMYLAGVKKRLPKHRFVF